MIIYKSISFLHTPKKYKVYDERFSYKIKTKQRLCKEFSLESAPAVILKSANIKDIKSLFSFSKRKIPKNYEKL